jgi:hypothetical protein
VWGGWMRYKYFNAEEWWMNDTSFVLEHKYPKQLVQGDWKPLLKTFSTTMKLQSTFVLMQSSKKCNHQRIGGWNGVESKQGRRIYYLWDFDGMLKGLKKYWWMESGKKEFLSVLKE